MVLLMSIVSEKENKTPSEAALLKLVSKGGFRWFGRYYST